MGVVTSEDFFPFCSVKVLGVVVRLIAREVTLSDSFYSLSSCLEINIDLFRRRILQLSLPYNSNNNW